MKTACALQEPFSKIPHWNRTVEKASVWQLAAPIQPQNILRSFPFDNRIDIRYMLNRRWTETELRTAADELIVRDSMPLRHTTRRRFPYNRRCRGRMANVEPSREFGRNKSLPLNGKWERRESKLELGRLIRDRNHRNAISVLFASNFTASPLDVLWRHRQFRWVRSMAHY